MGRARRAGSAAGRWIVVPAAVLALLALLAIAALAGCGGEAPRNTQAGASSEASPALMSSTSKQPSILFILYDDLDLIGDLGPYGADPDEVATPFSELLAEQGKRFDRFYVNAPVCSPTRVALLTGQYPTRFGFTWASDELSRRGVPGETRALPRLLLDRGYLTGAFGKWHIGHASDEIAPSGVGFERSALSCGYTNLGRGEAGGFEEAHFCAAPGLELESGATEASKFATTLTVDKTLEHIAQASDAGRPFYAQVWLHAPHRPLTCPPGFECPDCEAKSCTREQKRQIHHAMIAHAEAQLMRLREDLESRGRWRDTLVILASDNGGVGAWNEPSTRLRGEKASLYERGVRTPLLVAGPDISPGVVDERVVGLDLLPTIAELLDLAVIDGPGISFADLLRGSESEAEEMAHDRAEARAARTLFWELRPDARSDEHTLTGSWRRFAVQKVLDGKLFKLVQNDLWGGGVIPELYDLDADESESRNLTWQRASLRNHLLAELRQWRLETAAFRPEVADLEGAVSRHGEALFFEGGKATLEDQPVLHVGRFDLSLAFSLELREPLIESPLIEREGAWSIRLEKGRPVFEIEGNRPQRLVHRKELRPGQRYRIVAAIENRRGLALYVDDQAVRSRSRFGRVVSSNAPIRVGGFSGEVEDLVFYGVALRTDDLELGGLGHFDFEDPTEYQGRGGVEVIEEAAYKGASGLALNDGVWLALPGLPVSHQEFQVSAWVRTEDSEVDLSAPVGLEIYCSAAPAGEPSPSSSLAASQLATQDWRRIVVQHRCPAGTESMKLALVGHRQSRTFWDEIRLGALGPTRLALDFEGLDSESPSRPTSFAPADVIRPGRGGGHALRLSATGAPMSFRFEPGAESALEMSVWARLGSADLDGASAASIRLEQTCFDKAGAALAVDVANCDPNCVLSNPGRVTRDWQLFRLWSSCPPGTSQVGLRVLSEGDAVLIDDVGVTAY